MGTAALLVAGSLDAAVAAHASECAPPQWRLRQAPREHWENLPVGGTIWIEREEFDQDARGDANCRFESLDSDAVVEMTVELYPEVDPDGNDAVEQGCAISAFRFGTELAELTPAQPLATGTRYRYICGELPPDAPDDAVITTATLNPPIREDVDIQVREAVAYEDACDITDLRLVFDRFDDEFFTSGGLIVVEYAPDRIDVIRRMEQHEEISVAFVDLPLPQDETLTLRAFNGLGEEFATSELDVRGLGRNDGKCSLGAESASTHATRLVLWGLVVLAPRRRHLERRRARG